METKHTPGPWKHEPTCLADFKGFGRDIYSLNERGEYGRHVAQLPPSTVVDVDAALIAAAPDLLNMLERVMGEIDNSPLAEGNNVVALLTREQARAAIRKATGQ